MPSRFIKTLRYLLHLLRLAERHLLRFFHHIAHYLRQRRSAETPKPSIAPELRTLPSRRPRTLTDPPSLSTSQYTTYTQLQSPLFHLPLEIRRLIYRYALTSDIKHIVRLGLRLGHIHCSDPQHTRPWFHRCWGISVKGSDLYHGPHNDFLADEGTEKKNKRGLLPLVMACRRIYTEAIPVLYVETTFSMLHLETLISLSETVLPNRLNLIQSVELGWYFYFPHPHYCRKVQHLDRTRRDITTWERVWSILADMEGLRMLRVDLVGRWMEPLTAEQERLLLWPAMQVKRPRVWDLILDWEDFGGAGFDWEAQGAPFKVVRAEGFGNERFEEASIWNAGAPETNKILYRSLASVPPAQL